MLKFFDAVIAFFEYAYAWTIIQAYKREGRGHDFRIVNWKGGSSTVVQEMKLADVRDAKKANQESWGNFGGQRSVLEYWSPTKEWIPIHEAPDPYISVKIRVAD